MKDQRTLGSEAVKRSNDAMLRGLDHQQSQLQSDSNQLVLLQSKAQGAEGQMAAIQYGNQLASARRTSCQIRGMLIAQQQPARVQVAADREAQQAAHEASAEGSGIAQRLTRRDGEGTHEQDDDAVGHCSARSRDRVRREANRLQEPARPASQAGCAQGIDRHQRDLSNPNPKKW